jgi:ADP-ribose pyrophosphatase
VALSVDRVRLPNGQVTEREVVEHPGAAAVVPILENGDVVLIRHYRHATGRWLLEVPAGKLDPGEPPEVCAARELEEEVGYRADRLVPLGTIWSSPGFTDERVWLYLASELRPGRQRLGAHEVLEVMPLPLEQAIAMAASGEIADGKSVCALLRVVDALGGSSRGNLSSS